jgi:cholesterol oxidase
VSEGWPSPPISGAYDAVVVGSGFGGSIATLRLAESGRRVLLLERGRSYETFDFPRDPFDGPRLLWRRPERRSWRGLFDLRFHSGIATLTASGLGGGSLVYANVLLRPDARVFEAGWPRGFDLDSLSTAYARVEAVITPRPLPATSPLTKDTEMMAAVERMARTDDLVHPPLSIDWPDDHEAGCQLVAECEFGCRFGAKRTLDRTYLTAARRAGAEIRTDIEVQAIEPRAGGGYRIHALDLVADERVRIEAPRVVLAAGTLGTTRLLLRGRDVHGLLPRLGPRLGHGFSGNGDFIALIRGTERDLEPWRGPDVTAVLRSFGDGPGFTIATPTFSQPAMTALVRSAGMSIPGSRRLGPWIWGRLDTILPVLVSGPGAWLGRALAGDSTRAIPSRGPTTSDDDPEPRRDPSRATAVFAIGRDTATGQIVLRGRSKSRLDVEWDYERDNRTLIEAQTRTLTDLAAAYGGELSLSPTWNLARRTLTVHPLGGCAMASSPAGGVVSPDGEVFGYPGLFVADASVIPTSIGFHPALTIAAVAERIAESIVA